MSKEAEEERVKMLVRIVLLILIAVPFAISVNGADVVNPGSNLEGTSNAMAHEITLAETGITNSKHDFTFSVYLTPHQTVNVLPATISVKVSSTCGHAT